MKNLDYKTTLSRGTLLKDKYQINIIHHQQLTHGSVETPKYLKIGANYNVFKVRKALI